MFRENSSLFPGVCMKEMKHFMCMTTVYEKIELYVSLFWYAPEGKNK